MKLWTGRFSKEADQKTNDFNSSISFDSRMYQQDLQGSMAHATMLCACGIISEKDRDEILGGLQGILADIQSGKLAIDPDAEDIHTFVEAELTARIGEAGKRLHTARSRNDQVALDLRLYLRDACDALSAQVKELVLVLCQKAQEHAGTVMPGYTHLQRAQPITFGHHLMAYAEMFQRDLGRIADAKTRMDVCPLGSGALAGTTYPIDRAQSASLLGFSAVSQNSLDGVSDRDYCIELASALAILMMHLSRFSEEIVMWCSWEFKFIELDDAFSTGSSIMPQKKNPDIAELVRGKAGRVFGDVMTLLAVMKSLPLAYNKDMQEDKEPVFDTIDTVELCLPVFTAMIDTLTVNRANMRAAANGGFISATDCADYLAKKGMPFREAYGIVGKLVGHCVDTGHSLETLPLEEYQKVSPYFEADVYDALSLETCVNGRKVYGGPAPEAVKVQIENMKQFVAEREER